MDVQIHLQRLGKPGNLYTEGYLSDNGIRLITRTILPVPCTSGFSQQQKLIAPGQTIHVVTKHLFYAEWFDLIEFHNPLGELLGYYCDICTPLRQHNGAYYLTDLFLDLWVDPDGTQHELDWDEFTRACTAGFVTRAQEEAAVTALCRLKELFRSKELLQAHLK